VVAVLKQQLRARGRGRWHGAAVSATPTRGRTPKPCPNPAPPPQLHGYEPLRAQLHDLTRRLHAPPGGFGVTVTCGSTYGLDIALDLLLERGEPVVVEEYTYSHALDTQLMPKG
jgi:hypothetical protein